VGCRFHDERWLREELFGGRSTDPADGGEASPGRLALAAGGTLLVADLDQMPRPLQAALLEALRRPRAGGAPPPVLVATLEEEPERAAQAGRLHPDLAALFGARVVAVPGLAERPEDVAALAARFVESAAAELGRKAPLLTPRALDRLRALPWRGHVRELKAALEGAVALADGGLIDADRLPVDDGAAGPSTSASPPPAIDLSVPFSELKERWVDHFERAYIDAAIRRSAGNLSAAARLAQMDKKNFHAKAARFGLAGPASGGRNGSLKSGGRRSSMPPPEDDPADREDKT